MPSPGFYHQVWDDRATRRVGERGEEPVYRRLLARVVTDLRKRRQAVSTADLIAVETTARALAVLRGHAEVWRADLVDGIVGALVKEARAEGGDHPFLQAVYAVFRGGEQGRLAAGTTLPPLVTDIRRLLQEHELEPAPRERFCELDLAVPSDRERSRVLHRLRGVEITGYEQVGGSDLVGRGDLARVWERWRIRWSPEFEAACVEAAVYGATLSEAAAAKLHERAEGRERDAEAAALLLLEASLMGVETLAADFTAELARRIHEDASFFAVSGALGHLLYLYRYDEVLGVAGRPEVRGLLREAFERALWLLEGLGQAPGRDRDLVRGVSRLVETFEQCAASAGLDGEELTDVLHRTGARHGAAPLLRGAATGALWTLRAAPVDQVMTDLRGVADPSALGDYLTGLFALAREAVQRHPELVRRIDDFLGSYADEQFLEALPGLRLAFTFFTPREKHHLARTLLHALGVAEAPPLPALEVTPEQAADTLAFEARLFRTVEQYGLRGSEG